MSRNNRRGKSQRAQHQNRRNQARGDHRDSSQNNYARHHAKDAEQREAEQRHEIALRELKARKVVCAKCGQPIGELSSALADKKTGMPIHFDCVLEELKENERLGENDRITYIGQGRFAVLYFENIRDMRHFTITKIIEWEPHDSIYSWRSEMADLYSQVV